VRHVRFIVLLKASMGCAVPLSAEFYSPPFPRHGEHAQTIELFNNSTHNKDNAVLFLSSFLPLDGLFSSCSVPLLVSFVVADTLLTCALFRCTFYDIRVWCVHNCWCCNERVGTAARYCCAQKVSLTGPVTDHFFPGGLLACGVGNMLPV